MTTTHQIFGQPLGRVDGPEKVTGQVQYSADVSLPGTLWGKSLRSPYPHARIVRMDTAAARALPGVHAVLTGDDVRGVLYGRRLRDVPVLAWDEARFAGERVAAVAAEDEDIAQAALDLIEVEYEELPAQLDPLEAMQEGAPLIHPDMMSYVGYPQPPEKPSNVFIHSVWNKGDVAAGFAEADVVVENTFRVPRQHQAYLESHSCLVWIDDDGVTQIWASNKTPYNLRQQLSDATGVPQEAIRVNFAAIGGDFGGKGSPMEIPLCYYLAKASGRPVKMVMDYLDEFMAANPRHAAVMQVRTGLKRDGRMTAHHVRGVFDSGAYGAYKPGVNLMGFSHAGGPYHTPNVLVEGIQVYTNNVPCGHMRGPGEPQAAFAMESQLDMAARQLGLDPLEVRRRNVVNPGETDSLNHSFQGVNIRETLEAAVEAAEYGTAKEPNVGRGIAIGDRPPGGGHSHCSVTLHPDGTAELSTPIFEQGTGSYTLELQVIGEELGLPADRMHVGVWDTGAVDFDSGVGGSRVTRIGTQVAYAAAQEVKGALLRTAAQVLDVPAERLSFTDGAVHNRSTGAVHPWPQLLQRAGGPVTGQAEFADTALPPVTAYVAQVAEVSVDPETGQVKLLRLTTAHDVGQIVNPIGHQGQVNGGAMQGIGYALMEELQVEDGRVTTLSFGDYKIPTMNDLPEMRTVLVESESGVGPYNVKSIGENSVIPVAAAIANAVEDAVGVRITELPITAEKVYRALRERERG